MPLLEDYAASAHALKMHLKMYYTLGQMTNHMTELFALKSMGGEILLRNVSATPPTVSARRRLGMGDGLVANEVSAVFIGCIVLCCVNSFTDQMEYIMAVARRTYGAWLSWRLVHSEPWR